MKVYLALDPLDTFWGKPRVTMQTTPFDQELHRAPEHQLFNAPAWEAREAELEDETWAKLLGGELTPDEQDELHQRLWNESGPTPFPAS